MTDYATGRRRYVDYDPKAGYPAGSALYYECLQCGYVMPSLPQDSMNCHCWNIGIDIDYGRVVVRDHSLMRIFEALPSSDDLGAP